MEKSICKIYRARGPRAGGPEIFKLIPIFTAAATLSTHTRMPVHSSCTRSTRTHARTHRLAAWHGLHSTDCYSYSGCAHTYTHARTRARARTHTQHTTGTHTHTHRHAQVLPSIRGRRGAALLVAPRSPGMSTAPSTRCHQLLWARVFEAALTCDPRALRSALTARAEMQVTADPSWAAGGAAASARRLARSRAQRAIAAQQQHDRPPWSRSSPNVARRGGVFSSRPRIAWRDRRRWRCGRRRCGRSTQMA